MAEVKICQAIPALKAVLQFVYDDETIKEVIVEEGKLLKNVSYLDNGEVKTVNGLLKAINFTSKAFTSGKDYCIHDDESVFAKYVTVNSLVLDCSDKYECNVISVPVRMLKDIGGMEAAPVIAVNGVRYENMAAAIANAENGSTITLVEDTADDGIKIEEGRDIVIDLNGHTYSLLGGVGSPGTTANGLQLLKGSNVVIKNGTLTIPYTHKDKFGTGIQNYANLTLENVVLDGKHLDRHAFNSGVSYALSNNCGTINIIGNTSIIANDDGDKAFAFDVCKYANYEPPIVNVNTTGMIRGNIEVSEGLDANLRITGGTFTMDVSKWVPEGFVMKTNENGTYTVEAVVE